MSSAVSTHDQALRAARRCAIINVAVGGAIVTCAMLAWMTGESLYWRITLASLVGIPVMIKDSRHPVGLSLRAADWECRDGRPHETAL